ncbi:hypothetical protein CHS0354_013463 [Potamilus streckersoni]|uniref:Uncharacterized protein n=1 Tax=Potamilus streckersoni TaxID=2493646 RepID=A0AAE0RYI1_9BIVA|nr:hypothetical protein CHS0354_013463 [Potamilus streckersoni]
MASRVCIRRSHDQKRKASLQPGNSDSSFRYGSNSHFSSSSFDMPSVNEKNRRRSFPPGRLDINTIFRRNTSTFGRSGQLSPGRKFSDASSSRTDKNGMDTIDLALINNRFHTFCFCLLALFLLVLFASLYRLLT